MDDNLIGLSPEQFKLFRAMLDRYRQEIGNPRPRYIDESTEHQEYPTPDVFIAYSGDGIDALDRNTTGTGTPSLYDDSPGYADLEVYQIIWRLGGLTGTGTDPDTAIPLIKPVPGLTYRVYNISFCAVPPGIWIEVKRDKPGNWIATQFCAELGQCVAPGWDVCRRVVLRAWSECVGNMIISHEIVEYWYFCHGVVVAFSDTPCPTISDTPCSQCEAGTDPGDEITLGSGSGPTFGNGTCDDCTNVALPAHLARAAGNHCVWNSEPFQLCSTGEGFWQVVKGSSWTAVLIKLPEESAVLSYTLTTDSCVFPLELTKTGTDGGQCVGPDTVILGGLAP